MADNQEDSRRKIALVTGGSRGIGAAIAVRLAADGYDIWLNFRRNRERASDVAEKVRSLGRECLFLEFDVADATQTAQVLHPLLEERCPDILVNNAGISRDTIFGLMSDRDWEEVIDTSLRGFFGVPGQVNYSAAKAGLIGATKALAMEVARRRILVNAVAPGFIETEMIEHMPLDQILPRIPLGRLGRPEEVAALVSFLCSEEAGYITGQVFSINGGIYS
jgi:3-oxoacyl-[acyl-carrier protein] reductase